VKWGLFLTGATKNARPKNGGQSRPKITGTAWKMTENLVTEYQGLVERKKMKATAYQAIPKGRDFAN